MKKVIAIILSVLMCISVFSFTASALESDVSNTWGSLNWTLTTDGTLTISGSGDMLDFESENTSDAWRAYKNDITKVVIGENVTSVCDYAFRDCGYITEASLPSTITEIGKSAFSACTRLEKVNLPEGLLTIGDGAFTHCMVLKDVAIPSTLTSLGYCPYDGCYQLENLSVAAGNTVYHSEGGCIIETAAKKVILGSENSTIPADGSVTVIGDSAFYTRKGLTSIVIPEGVTDIEAYAFSFCNALETVSLPATLEEIGYSAFSSTAIKEIVIPASVTTLDTSIFDDCEKLVKVTLNEGITEIPQEMFDGCQALADINFPASLEKIGAEAFSGCYALDSVTFAEGFKEIGTDAFSNSGVKSVNLPASFTTLGNGAFRGCGLTGINVAEGNTTYESKNNCFINKTDKSIAMAFEGASIPTDGSVEKIGDSAFAGAGYLTELVIPSNIVAIGAYAFQGSSITSVSIPSSVTFIGNDAFNSCENLVEVTFPGTVETMGGYMFSSCENLSKLTIEEGVKTIGGNIISYCQSLTSVHIPASVESIDPYAFDNAYALEYLTVAEGNSAYYSVNNCIIKKGEKKLVFGAKNSIIPNDGSVTTIGDSAFYGRNPIDAIVIPVAITTIEIYGLNLHDNGIGTVYYEGTEEQWNDITIGGSNSDLLEATKVYNAVTATFIMPDGAIIGIVPAIDGTVTAPEVPVVEGKEFSGWDKALTGITKPVIVTANYQNASNTVTFVGKDGETLKTEDVEFGKGATAPEAPAVEGYTFSGWDKSFDNVTEDITVTAIYEINKYTVTFVGKDGETLKTETVEHGNDATAPEAPAIEGYEFIGWDVEFTDVNGNLVVSAKYNSLVALGDVNEDGYVDNLDAAMLLKYDAGIIGLDASKLALADVNKDGYADNLDAAMILKYDAGILDSIN